MSYLSIDLWCRSGLKLNYKIRHITHMKKGDPYTMLYMRYMEETNVNSKHAFHILMYSRYGKK